MNDIQAIGQFKMSGSCLQKEMEWKVAELCSILVYDEFTKLSKECKHVKLDYECLKNSNKRNKVSK